MGGIKAPLAAAPPLRLQCELLAVTLKFLAGSISAGCRACHEVLLATPRSSLFL